MGIQAANGNVVTVELDKLPAGSSPSLVLLDSLAPREGATPSPQPPPSELGKDENPAADVRKTRQTEESLAQTETTSANADTDTTAQLYLCDIKTNAPDLKKTYLRWTVIEEKTAAQQA